jgi:N-acetylmuramoyl-L-alanine amidase
LSQAEWDLVAELLEQECRELPVEIHHTRTSSVKTQLQDRLEMARSALEHVRAAIAV